MTSHVEQMEGTFTVSVSKSCFDHVTQLKTQPSHSHCTTFIKNKAVKMQGQQSRLLPSTFILCNPVCLRSTVLLVKDCLSLFVWVSGDLQRLPEDQRSHRRSLTMAEPLLMLLMLTSSSRDGQGQPRFSGLY